MYLRGRIARLRRLVSVNLLRRLLDASSVDWYLDTKFGFLVSLNARDNLELIVTQGKVLFSEDVVRFCLVQSGAVAVDVGANNGMVSLALSKNFERVFAFEPDPRCEQTFKRNLKVNHVENVSYLPLGVTSASGNSEFFLADEPGHSSLSGRHITLNRCKITTPSVSIDDFIHTFKISRIDLMKIDVEGHELEVLEGSRGALRSGIISLIVFEHSPILLKLQNRENTQVFDFLAGFNYQIATLTGFKLARQDLEFLEQTDLIARPIDTKVSASD